MQRAAVIVSTTVLAVLSSTPASAAWTIAGVGSTAGQAASAPAAVTQQSASCSYNAATGLNDITVQWTVSTTSWAPTQVTKPNQSVVSVPRPLAGVVATLKDSQPVNGGNERYVYSLRAGAGSGRWLSAAVTAQTPLTSNASRTRGRCV